MDTPRTALALDVPEHGQLQLPLAGVGRRTVAALVDLGVMLALGLVVLFVAMLGLPEAARAVTVFAAAAMLPVAGPLAFELAWDGQTPGKRFAELRVVSKDGRRAGYGQLFLRNVLRVLDFLPFAYFLGLCSVFVSTYGQRLGDLVAGTVLVREDAAALLESGACAEEVAVPAELAGVPPSVLRGARLLLEPSREIDAAARQSREREIAALVRRHRPDLGRESDDAIWRRLQGLR